MANKVDWIIFDHNWIAIDKVWIVFDNNLIAIGKVWIVFDNNWIAMQSPDRIRHSPLSIGRIPLVYGKNYA
ncbi:hypothetical protein [Metabacillus sp. 84]|uniref:hypothetical protein n=1 Tax=Metabacillus sp. 84 TaxID=3404705 RepID=UPI003CF6C749